MKAPATRRTSTNRRRGRLIAIFLWCLSCLPFTVLQRLGGAFGRLRYVCGGRARRTVEANLACCFPEQSAVQQRRLALCSLQASTTALLEMGAIWHWSCEKNIQLIVDVRGQALLDLALAKKRGVILLTPHIGNWELVGYYAAQQARVTSLYAPSKIPELDRLMYEGRIRNGSTLVPTNTAGVRSLLKALKAGEVVIILPDQVPEEGAGLFAPFFGRPAYTMTLLTSLAQRTGAEVLCCYALRRADRRGFDVVVTAADPAIAAADEQQAVNALNRSVENCVLACPEQYQWEYKRFRERPAGMASLY